MKKILVTILLSAILGICLVAKAATDEIDVNEPQPALTKWKLDTVRILAFTQTAEIYFRKGYIDGSTFVGTNQGHLTRFMNQVDNPETPEDETSTEFTDFIQYIQNRISAGDTLKQAIVKAVRIKEGIE